jgi:serine/threonine-protein kinase
MALASPTETRRIGRYLLGPEIAAGAASVVHLGLLDGAEGFRRAVAIKRLHASRRSPRAFSALRREAVISASVRHPNTIAVLDLVHDAGELFVVMEYVLGDDLAQLLTVVAPLPARVAVRIALDVLSALHAVHSACSPAGHPLQLVHRDVSPQNVLIGVDGASRLTDFGVARCLSDDAITAVGAVKGATGYVSPELASGGPIDARADVFAAAVVLWEMLIGKRLFKHVFAADALTKAIELGITPPSELNPRVPARLDDVLLRALSGIPAKRPSSARAFADELASAVEVASHEEVADLLKANLRKNLAIREAQLRALQAVRPTIQLAPSPTFVVPPAPDESVPLLTRTAPSSRPEQRVRDVRRTWLTPSWAALCIGILVAIFFSLSWSERWRRSTVTHPTTTFPGSTSSRGTPAQPTASVSLRMPPAPAPIIAADDLPPAQMLPTSRPAPVRRVPPSRLKKGAPKAAPVAAPCAEPFVVDARGIKRVRPECY